MQSPLELRWSSFAWWAMGYQPAQNTYCALIVNNSMADLICLYLCSTVLFHVQSLQIIKKPREKR